MNYAKTFTKDEILPTIGCVADVAEYTNGEFGTIRTVTVNGEPWFVAKDICEVLQYANSRKAIIDHVDIEDKIDGVTIRDSIGREQKPICINESGIYALIFSSKMPKAKEFKHWVTSEVLPSIRKHGIYATDNVIDEILNNPDFGIELLTKLKEERKARLKVERKNVELLNDNQRMKPKEIFADAVSASDSSMLVRDVAKIIKQNGVPLGEKRFYRWLRENGYVCQNGTSPTQRAMELGLFEIVVRTIERGNGLPIETKTTKVTGKGQQYFINKFLNAEERSA